MQSIDVRGFLFSPQSKPEISNLMVSFFAGGDPKNVFFLDPPPKKFSHSCQPKIFHRYLQNPQFSAGPKF